MDLHAQRDEAISRELAELLHVSHRTVLGWQADGRSLLAIRRSLGESVGLHDGGWISIASVAARFEVDSKTVRRWISAGRIEARRFGPRLIRVSVSSVIRMSNPLSARDAF